MAARFARLLLLHTTINLRTHRNGIVVLLIVAVTDEAWRWSGLGSTGLALVAAAVCGLALAECAGARQSQLQTLPHGMDLALGGRLFALFIVVCGLTFVQQAASELVRVLLLGAPLDFKDMAERFATTHAPNMMGLTLGIWLMTVAGWCRNRLQALGIGGAVGYLAILPVMWVRGGGQPLRWDAMTLPVPESGFGLPAAREAAEYLTSTGWGPLFAIAAAWLGRRRRVTEPAARWRAGWRSTAVILLGCGLTAGHSFWTEHQRNQRSVRGQRLIHSAWIDPTGTIAYLATPRNALRLDLRTGEPRLLESAPFRGHLVQPFTGTGFRGPPGQVYRDVTVIAHMSFKPGAVRGWNLLDTRTGALLGHATDRLTPTGLEAEIRDSQRRSSRWFLPDGRRCWFLRGALEVATADGFATVDSWDRRWRPGPSQGFLIRVTNRGDDSWFDLARRTRYAPNFSAPATVWGLPDYWLVDLPATPWHRGPRQLLCHEPHTGREWPARGLRANDSIETVLLDGRVLVLDRAAAPDRRLALVDPLTGARQAFAAPGIAAGARLHAPFPPAPGPLVLELPGPEISRGLTRIMVLRTDRLEVTRPITVFRHYSTIDDAGWVFTTSHGVEKVNLFTGERIQLFRPVR